MYSRSGPRTDGRCAEGPRVEWFDDEARPTHDPARGAERPARTTPPQTFLKPYLCVAWWRVERLNGEARPTHDPARGAERPALTTPQQLFLKPSPKTVCSALGPRLAAHQAGRDIAYRSTLVQYLIDLQTDREVHAVAGGELDGGAGGGDAFDHFGRTGHNLKWIAAAADLLARPAIAAVAAGARGDDVPQPGQAGDSPRITSRGLDEPANFSQRTRDQRGARVVAIAKPVSRPGRQRDDVLERAAQLDADQVGRGIHPKRWPVEQLLEQRGDTRVGARDDGRGRQPAADFFSMRRPRERRDVAGGNPELGSRHLGQAAQGRKLQPLGGVQHRHPGINPWSHDPRHLAHGARDGHQEHRAGTRHHVFDRSTRPDRRRNSHPWQIHPVFAGPSDVLGLNRAAAPQPNVVPGIPEHD